jgi:hypothetical protein
MKFQKGVSGTPTGRPTGAKDKIQSDIKDAYQSLIEGNLKNIETWLNEVAAKDPGKAIELLLRLSEFILPKIKSIEIDANIKTPQIIEYINVSKQFPDK